MGILYSDTQFKTMEEAPDACNSDVLLEFARLFIKKTPRKKAERVSAILGELAGERLRSFWNGCGPRSYRVARRLGALHRPP